MSGLTHMYMDYRPCTPGASGSIRCSITRARARARNIWRFAIRVLPRISPFERLVYDFKNHHPRPDALGRRAFPRADRLDDHLRCPARVDPAQSRLPYGDGTRLAHLQGRSCSSSVERSRNIFTVLFTGKTIPGSCTRCGACGLLMTPEAHALHHETLRRDFATNNGWSNPL